MALAGWLSAADRRDCKTCRESYVIGPWDTPKMREAKKNGPPCATCFPGVHPDNEIVYAVYARCQNQWDVAPSGKLICIRSEAIDMAMRMCRVVEDDQPEIFDRVSAMSNRIAVESNKNA